jgi:hypothetical protein
MATLYCPLLAIFAILGGAVPGHTETGASVRSSPFTWRVRPMPPGANGGPTSFGEPGIAIDRGGTVVVNASQANAGLPPTWWISRNDGRTWGAGMNFDPSEAVTGDADAAIGADGSLYALNLGYKDPPQQPTNPTVLVFASRDGRQWEGPATFPPPHGADQPDRPWLVPDPFQPSGVIMVNSEGTGNVVSWRSIDHARTFTGPTLVTGVGRAASVVLTSRPMFDPVHYGRVYMLYEASTATGTAAQLANSPVQPLRDFPLTQLWLAVSDDAGKTWSNSLVLDIGSEFGSAAAGGSLGHVLPASAIDKSGTIYAAFSLRLGGGSETHIYLVHSTDHGEHWSLPVLVDSGGLRSNVMPALAAGSRGRVDVSWYGSSSPDFTSPTAEWSEMFAQSLNSLSPHPAFRQSRVSGSRSVHVGDIDATGNVGSNLYDWDLRDFQSIAVDARGMAHLVWTNDNGPGSSVTATQIGGPAAI